MTLDDDSERTIVADRDGVIRHWGGECQRVFGHTAEEAIGRRVDLIIPPVLHARHWRGFHRAISSGRLKRPDPTLKLPGVDKSGAIVPFHGTLRLDHGEDGTVEGATATIFRRGPAWQGVAWRMALSPLRLGRAISARQHRARPGSPNQPD
jgi:PAS domain S-box-containing protein